MKNMEDICNVPYSKQFINYPFFEKNINQQLYFIGM